MSTKFISLVSLAAPIIFYTFLGQVLNIITFYYVGRIDGAEFIGAATLGNMMCNITGYSLMIGMCSALDTLLSQAYGAKQYLLLGLYVQRAMLILTASSIPILLLWSQTDQILIHLLGIDPIIAELACQWARMLAPGLWPMLIFEAFKRWLQSQNILWPTMVSSGTAGLINFMLNYIFFYKCEPSWGYKGVAIALVLTQWLQMLILIMIITIRKYCIYHIIRRETHHSQPSTLLQCIQYIGQLIGVKYASIRQQDEEYQGLTSSITESKIDLEIANKLLLNPKTLKSPYFHSGRFSTISTTASSTESNQSHSPHKHQDSHMIIKELESDNLELSSVHKNHQNISRNESNDHYEDTTLLHHISNNNQPPQNTIYHKNKNKNHHRKHDDVSNERVDIKEVDNDEEEDCENNFPYDNPAILDEWLQFLKLGVPGAASLMIEWGSFELAASIASKLGPVALAVHGIFMTTANFLYMTPYSVSQATAILIGQHLGSKEYKDAKYIAKLGIILDFCYGAIAGGILITVLRPYWGHFFTTDQAVRDLVYKTLPVMLLYTITDSTKCIVLNILRSTGRPTITVIVNTLVCLVILLPLGYYFALHMHLGLFGLWNAMSIAWFVATIIYFYIVIQTNWESLRIEELDRNIIHDNIHDETYSVVHSDIHVDVHPDDKSYSDTRSLHSYEHNNN